MYRSVRTVGRILRRRPGLVGVYLLYFGANVLLYTIIVYYPQLLETIGVTSALGISLYLAASGAAGGISGALYGRLVIRATRMQLVTIAFLLWSVAFGMITLIDTPVAAAPPVFLFGLGIGLVFPSTFAWVEALAPQDRQGQFSSYIASFGYTGQFLSPLLFGPLVCILGVRGAFGAAGVTTGWLRSDWSERTFGPAIEIGRMFVVGLESLIK
ncbi:MAG: MFS transporter [Salinarchaeum sp.]